MEPIDLEGRTAWFRVYNCFGTVMPCFWHPETHATELVTAQAALRCGADVKSMHDPTRGGLATVCNEVAARASVHIALDEGAVPVHAEALSQRYSLGGGGSQQQG